MTGKKNTDLDIFLEEEITVELKGGCKLQGTLTKCDDYMNMVLKNAKEFKEEDLIREHKLVIVKGGNIRSVST